MLSNSMQLLRGGGLVGLFVIENVMQIHKKIRREDASEQYYMQKTGCIYRIRLVTFLVIRIILVMKWRHTVLL